AGRAARPLAAAGGRPRRARRRPAGEALQKHRRRVAVERDVEHTRRVRVDAILLDLMTEGCLVNVEVRVRPRFHGRVAVNGGPVGHNAVAPADEQRNEQQCDAARHERTPPARTDGTPDTYLTLPDWCGAPPAFLRYNGRRPPNPAHRKPPMTRDLILGTAGHIDHGKTSLVKALTGIDCDRLPEEK